MKLTCKLFQKIDCLTCYLHSIVTMTTEFDINKTLIAYFF